MDCSRCHTDPNPNPTPNPTLTLTLTQGCGLLQAGVYTYPAREGTELATLELHGLSTGAAQAATTLWLHALADASLDGRADLPAKITVDMGRGRRRGGRVTGRVWEVEDAVTSLLEELGSPFQASQGRPGVCLEADQADVCAWLGGLGPVSQRVCGDNRRSRWEGEA